MGERRARRAGTGARSPWRVGVGAMAVVAVLLVPVTGSAVGHAGAKHSPGESSAADGAIDAMANSVKAAPKGLFSPKSARRALLKLVKKAEAQIDAGSACGAAAQLGPFEQTARSGLAGSSPAQATLADSLLAQATSAQGLILGGGQAGGCGGASAAGVSGPQSVTTVSSSDVHQIRLHVAFTQPTFAPQAGGGSSYLEMTAPGEGTGGDVAVGQPEVPLAAETIAVPLGAVPAVQVLGTTGYQLPAVQLWPTQPSGAAPAGGPGSLPPALPPFTIDPAAYQSASSFPAQGASLGPVGSERGLSVVSLTIAGGSYVPASRSLTVLTGADVQVTFGGPNNSASFGTTDITSPWNLTFQNIYQSTVLNWPAVQTNVGSTVARALCGEEMMVITSSALVSAADTFAADRTAHGVLTKVFVTDGPFGTGTTPAQIRTAIASQYNGGCSPRPSYVTLLGSTSVVPTFELSMGFNSQGNPNFYEDPIATDQPYGYIHQASAIDSGDYSDLNPDILVGRIPARVLSEAALEVSVINQYEDSPPTSPSLYQHVTGAEFFQACPAIQADCKDGSGNYAASTQDRTSFLRTSESVGTEATVAGKSFVRVAYDEAPDDPGATIDPQTFDNGTPLPGGINWNGNATDITNSVNAGSFLVWHSDHGYTNGAGWGYPSFTAGNVPSLANTLKSVFWSSDCDSGKFDAPSGMPYVSDGTSPSFSEYVLDTGRGVGSVGSSRESAIYWDGIMLQGMGAAIFPEEGNVFRALFSLPLLQPVLQLGALLNSAKDHTMSTADMATDIGAQGTMLEYNAFGDPSMAIHRDAPSLIDQSLVNSVLLDPTDVAVNTTQASANGAVVTLVQNGQFIGRGVVTNGTADVATSVDLTGTAGVQAIIGGDPYATTTVSF